MAVVASGGGFRLNSPVDHEAVAALHGFSSAPVPLPVDCNHRKIVGTADGRKWSEIWDLTAKDTVGSFSETEQWKTQSR